MTSQRNWDNREIGDSLAQKPTNDDNSRRDTVMANLNEKAIHSAAEIEIFQHESEKEEERVFFSESAIQSGSTFSKRKAAVQSSGSKSPTTTEKKRKREKQTKKEKEANWIALNNKADLEEVAELSRNRSMFNGNKDLLPSIGGMSEGHICIGSIPKIGEKSHVIKANNIIDVTSRHETSVKSTAMLKEAGNDLMNKYDMLMQQQNEHPNNAPEIIAKIESIVGRAFEGKGCSRNTFQSI